MCSNWLKVMGLVVAVVLVGVSSTTADVFPPGIYEDPEWAPQWFKDCEGYKSWADWSFGVEDPDKVYAPDNEGWNWHFMDVGDPAVDDNADMHDSARLELTGNAAWVEWHAQKTGVVGGDSPVDFHVWMDNEEAPLIKQVWFQCDVWVTLGEWGVVEDAAMRLSGPGGGGLVPMNITLGEPQAGGWRTVTAYWELPQPEWEQVDILFDVLDEPMFLDNVKMATQCVPEPGMLTMLALGGLALLRRHRA